MPISISIFARVYTKRHLRSGYVVSNQGNAAKCHDLFLFCTELLAGIQSIDANIIGINLFHERQNSRSKEGICEGCADRRIISIQINNKKRKQACPQYKPVQAHHTACCSGPQGTVQHDIKLLSSKGNLALTLIKILNATTLRHRGDGI